MSIDIGINDFPQIISDVYIGVDNSPRNVVAGWIGDANNLPQLIFSGAKVPAFSEATDEEIVDVLNKHYSGKLDVSKYWKAGETRVINGTTWVILGTNANDLEANIGSRSKTALTLMDLTPRSSALGTSTATTSQFYETTFYKNNLVEGKTLFSKLDSALGNIGGAKTVKVPYINRDSKYVYTYASKFFWPSATELEGTKASKSNYEGEQYDFFKERMNRMLPLGNADTYWTRTTYYNSTSGTTSWTYHTVSENGWVSAGGLRTDVAKNIFVCACL